MGIGPYHLVTGIDRHIWIYYLGKTLGDQPQLIGEKEFTKNITEVQLNSDYYAIWSSTEIILQSIPAEKGNTQSTMSAIFPSILPALSDTIITAFILCREFLILASDVMYQQHRILTFY